MAVSWVFVVISVAFSISFVAVKVISVSAAVGIVVVGKVVVFWGFSITSVAGMSWGIEVISVAFADIFVEIVAVTVAVVGLVVVVDDVVMSFGFSVILVTFSVLFQAAKVV